MKLTKFILKKSLPSANNSFIKPLKGIKMMIFRQAYRFIDSYENILQKKFPKAFKIYQIFTLGTRDFLGDIVEYMRISRELSFGKKVQNLSYKQLLIYFTIPKDLKKVGPTLFIAAFPFANYVVFPVAYLFPKHFLSSHFWNLEQKINFQVENLVKRLLNNRPVFRHLQDKLTTIPPTQINYQNQVKLIFDKLGSGIHPSPQEIISVSNVFIGKPFGLNYLCNAHLTWLCKMHNLSILPFKRLRLWTYAEFIHEMDLAIIREGGPQTLTDDQMRGACFLRGLNPLGVSKTELIYWLNQWLQVSKNIENLSLSLLLHCPILLGYNQLSNWRLIYQAKAKK